MPIVFELRDEFIRLDGVAESRRRAKLRAGQCVDYAGETIALVAKKEP